jgi:hypothetical protein
MTNCVGGARGAPADVDTEIPAMDAKAKVIANDVATQTATDPVTADVRAALDKRFGLPPVLANGKSMNRLTGATVADQDTAIRGEVTILSRRFAMSTRIFSQNIFYRCVGPEGGSSIGGCSIQPADCANGHSWSCVGVNAIFMCPGFWSTTNSTDERALILVHESLHMQLGTTTANLQGEIGEGNPRGSGGRFNNASCYESFASDLTGVTVQDTCPTPPAP